MTPPVAMSVPGIDAMLLAITQQRRLALAAGGTPASGIDRRWVFPFVLGGDVRGPLQIER
jgi:hypothetical protein